jgi:hypothetical protein
VFPKHLLELEWIVVGKEDVVVGERRILPSDPQKDDKPGDSPFRLRHLGSHLGSMRVLNDLLIGPKNIAVVEYQVSADLFP